MPIGTDVCATCRGKQRIYRGHQRWEPCPDCANKIPRREYRRAQAIDTLAHCWSAYRKGDTGDFNLALAVRQCVRAEYDLATLHKRFDIPMDTLRKAAGGQGVLSAE